MAYRTGSTQQRMLPRRKTAMEYGWSGVKGAS
jgi:hypothetical protein